MNKTETNDQKDLYAGVREGQPQALSQFYDQHAPLLYPLCRRTTHNDAEAQDVLAGIFLAVWTRLQVTDLSRPSAELWNAFVQRSRALDRACSRNLTDRGPSLTSELVRPSPTPPAALKNQLISFFLREQGQRRQSHWKLWAAAGWVAAISVVFLLGKPALNWREQARSAGLDLKQSADSRSSDQALINFFSQARHWVPLTPLSGDQSQGTLALSVQQKTAAVFVTGLAPLDDRDTYRIWLVENGVSRLAQDFRTDPQGQAQLLFPIPETHEKFQAVLVTAEPRTQQGPEPIPSGTTILVGQWIGFPTPETTLEPGPEPDSLSSDGLVH